MALEKVVQFNVPLLLFTKTIDGIGSSAASFPPFWRKGRFVFKNICIYFHFYFRKCTESLHLNNGASEPTRTTAKEIRGYLLGTREPISDRQIQPRRNSRNRPQTKPKWRPHHRRRKDWPDVRVEGPPVHNEAVLDPINDMPFY